MVRRVCSLESTPKSMGLGWGLRNQSNFDGVTQRTIRTVVVITRHGARFPLKPFVNSMHWPAEPLFWKTYGGKLTSEVLRRARAGDS